jgi:hypothetical protein
MFERGEPKSHITVAVPPLRYLHRPANRAAGDFATAYMAGLLPSVAQPPLPLQEFFALHPLSLALQPPCPLHSFCPLQPCLPFASSICWSATPALLLAVVVAAYERTANDPVRRPATAAPAITALDGLIIFDFFLVSIWCLFAFATALLLLGRQQNNRSPICARVGTIRMHHPDSYSETSGNAFNISPASDSTEQITILRQASARWLATRLCLWSADPHLQPFAGEDDQTGPPPFETMTRNALSKMLHKDRPPLPPFLSGPIRLPKEGRQWRICHSPNLSPRRSHPGNPDQR